MTSTVKDSSDDESRNSSYSCQQSQGEPLRLTLSGACVEWNGIEWNEVEWNRIEWIGTR